VDRLSFPDGFVRRAEPGSGNVDEIRFLDTLVRNVDSPGNRRIPAGCNVFVRGWAYNPSPARPARAVLATIDDGMSFDVAYGRSRPDIALSFGVPELEACGFQAIYGLAGLGLGQHVVKIVTLDESDGFFELPHTEAFEIVPSRELFPGVARAPDERMRISIDAFTALRAGSIPSGGMLLVERGDIVYVRGWAFDLENATSLRGIFAIVDDDDYVMGVHGLPREDVARDVRLPDVVRCGFTLRIATRSLKPGLHELRVAALANDDTYGIASVGTFEIS
jgi:hypothetical protein